MMVGLLLYAYCSGVRSSRAIERRCVEDIAFRVLAGNHCPDHVTIARFRQRHELALAEVLVDSLRLCATAGLLELGTVTLDGTKIEAERVEGREPDDWRTSRPRWRACSPTRTRPTPPRMNAERRDRDGGVPPKLADPRSRLARLQAAKARLEADAAERAERFAQRSRQLNEARAAKGLPARTFGPDHATRPPTRPRKRT